MHDRGSDHCALGGTSRSHCRNERHGVLWQTAMVTVGKSRYAEFQHGDPRQILNGGVAGATTCRWGSKSFSTGASTFTDSRPHDDRWDCRTVTSVARYLYGWHDKFVNSTGVTVGTTSGNARDVFRFTATSADRRVLGLPHLRDRSAEYRSGRVARFESHFRKHCRRDNNEAVIGGAVAAKYLVSNLPPRPQIRWDCLCRLPLMGKNLNGISLMQCQKENTKSHLVTACHIRNFHPSHDETATWPETFLY